MSLSKLWEIAKDEEKLACCSLAALQRAGHDLAAEQQQDKDPQSLPSLHPKLLLCTLPFPDPLSPPPPLEKAKCAGSPLATLMGRDTHHMGLWEISNPANTSLQGLEQSLDPLITEVQATGQRAWPATGPCI